MRYFCITLIALCLTGLDQLSKFLVSSSLAPYESVPLTGFFNLVHVRNRGAAFGFLNDPSISWQHWLFLGASLLAALIVFYVARNAAAKDNVLFVSLGCILGGAFGNMIDRIRFRAVVDFLDFHAGGWHWPAFNIADIAICIGAGLILVLAFRRPPDLRTP